MSIEALGWVQSLRLSSTSLAAYRVLGKLANVAHSDGKGAYLGKKQIAVELDCDATTVKRAYRELEANGLIKLGDQRLVAHVPANRRPTVYNLPIMRSYSQLELDEILGGHDEQMSPHLGGHVRPPKPVDNSRSGGSIPLSVPITEPLIKSSTKVNQTGSRDHGTQDDGKLPCRGCLSGRAVPAARYGLCPTCKALETPLSDLRPDGVRWYLQAGASVPATIAEAVRA